jgi:quercetin dioxygenase-like cupin family protein
MSQYFPAASELADRTISPGVGLRIMSSQHMSLSQATLAADATVPEHSHPHEQIGIVIDGRVRFTIGTEEKLLGPGDVFCIPGNVPHKVTVLDKPARIIDCFHPVRDEYR